MPSAAQVQAAAGGRATHPREPHTGGTAGRLNWLRAAVLGANDGIVSVAGIVIGAWPSPMASGTCSAPPSANRGAGTGGVVFARVRKTWAGLTKEMLTPSDRHTVDFAGLVSHPARTLTVMLDLTLYEPL